MRIWINFVVRHAKIILLLIILVSIYFAFKLPYIIVDTDLENNLPADIPEMIFLEEVNLKFPSTKDYAIVGLVMPEGQDVFQKDALARIDAISKQCYDIPGVVDVISLTTYEKISLSPFGIASYPFYSPDLLSPEELGQFRNAIEADPFIKENFIGPDARATAIMMIVDENVNDGEKELFMGTLEAIVEGTRGPGETHIGGKLIVDTLLGQLIVDDLKLLVPFVLLVLLLVLLVSFGTFGSVFLTLMMVLLGMTWSIGIMVMAKIPISISTMIVPVLLSAVGTAYGIHLLNKFYEDLPDFSDRKELLLSSANQVGHAVLLSGLTTVAGFLSLVISPITPIQTLGFVAAMGVAIALLLSLTFMPAALSLLAMQKRKYTVPVFNKILGKFLNLVGNIMSRKRWIISLSIVAVLIFAVMGLPLISTETNPIGTLPYDHKFRQTYDVFNEHLFGTTAMQLIVSGDSNEFYSLPVMQKIDEIEQKLQEDPQIGMIQSLNFYVKKVNQSLYGGDENYYALPNSQTELEDVLFFLELGETREEMPRFVTDDFSAININIFLRTGNSLEVEDCIAYIEETAQSILPDLDCRLTGTGYLYMTINKLLIQVQTRSILISILLVLLIVALLFRSFTKGLLSLFTLSSAIILNFGLMGWLNIPLDLATVTIASIAVGMGVDYSIHFLSRLDEELKHYSLDRAITRTIVTAGKAISFNALAVMFGFLVLLFSNFQTLKNIGLLIAITMVTTSVGALTILPLAIIYLKPSFTKGRSE